MKNLSWLVAGLTLGGLVYILLNTPAPRYATNRDELDDAADSAAGWGARQRLSGTGDTLASKVKQSVGNLTGNDGMAGKGLVDQAAGAVKDAAGQVAGAAGDALHGLNK